MLSSGRSAASVLLRTSLNLIKGPQGRRLINPSFSRLFSFSSDYLNVEANPTTGIAVFKMHNRPVNSMGFSFLQDSIKALKELENSGYKAVIITSSLPKIFCAGLDFPEVVKPKEERLRQYWQLFEDFIVAVYSAKLATISAINGFASAGGCVLALATDYRVIIENGKIGLNEVAIGLPLHSWIVQLTANVAGMRTAELAGLTGVMVDSEKALKWGLVDEIAANDKELIQKAESQAKIYARLPDINSWYITKMEGRKPLVDLIRSRIPNKGVFLESINSEATQNILSSHADKLKKKK